MQTPQRPHALEEAAAARGASTLPMQAASAHGSHASSVSGATGSAATSPASMFRAWQQEVATDLQDAHVSGMPAPRLPAAASPPWAVADARTPPPIGALLLDAAALEPPPQPAAEQAAAPHWRPAKRQRLPSL
jgi:hypothetical protein